MKIEHFLELSSRVNAHARFAKTHTLNLLILKLLLIYYKSKRAQIGLKFDEIK